MFLVFCGLCGPVRGAALPQDYLGFAEFTFLCAGLRASLQDLSTCPDWVLALLHCLLHLLLSRSVSWAVGPISRQAAAELIGLETLFPFAGRPPSGGELIARSPTEVRLFGRSNDTAVRGLQHVGHCAADSAKLNCADLHQVST